jgi:hypothetical protein
MTINNRTILSSLLVLSLFALGGCEEKKLKSGIWLIMTN